MLKLWCQILILPALGGLKQDCHEFEASLGYIVSSMPELHSELMSQTKKPNKCSLIIVSTKIWKDILSLREGTEHVFLFKSIFYFAL